jgi:hypothetical protein
VTTNPEDADDPDDSDDVADVEVDEQATATRPAAIRPAAARVNLA